VQRDGGNTNVELGAGNDSYILRIKEPAAPHSVAAQQNGDTSLLDDLSNWDDFNRPGSGWYYDAAGRYLWIRSAGDGSALTLSYKF
ncbi:MAG TPA: hypothetical protein VHX16_04545, partial [Chloroflexota bacterium]|nr:hypothetical protein [Chloroflexota bacterium]